MLQEGEVIVTGKELLPGKARGNLSVNGQTEVELRFNAEGRKKFADYTMRNVKRSISRHLPGRRADPLRADRRRADPDGDGVIRAAAPWKRRRTRPTC